jgi:hypothetical protein
VTDRERELTSVRTNRLRQNASKCPKSIREIDTAIAAAHTRSDQKAPRQNPYNKSSNARCDS